MSVTGYISFIHSSKNLYYLSIVNRGLQILQLILIKGFISKITDLI